MPNLISPKESKYEKILFLHTVCSNETFFKIQLINLITYVGGLKSRQCFLLIYLLFFFTTQPISQRLTKTYPSQIVLRKQKLLKVIYLSIKIVFVLSFLK